MSLLSVGLLASLDLLLRQRPEELGLVPDGNGFPAEAGVSSANIVDATCLGSRDLARRTA